MDWRKQLNQSKSEHLFNEAKERFPGGVHSPVRAFKGVGGTPPFISSAKGVYLKDVDGHKYTDFCLSWGPLILGHQDPDVKKEVLNAIEQGWSYGTTEPYSLELSRLIQEKIPFAEKIRFVNSGTEAVMSALRVARAATQKDKIIKFNGCYHGHTDSLLVKAGSGLAEMSSPDSAGVTPSCAQDTLIADLNDLESVETLFKTYQNQIAAVIIEPLPANNGLLPQTTQFLRDLESLTKKNKALLIFDEVISGFRIGFGGMAEKTGITPDLVTYGKIIGGGFPVGAYAGKKEWMDLVAPIGPVYQAGTLSANPVAIRAGMATLQKLCETNPYSRLESLSQKLKLRLEERKIPVQTEGSLFWMPACQTDQSLRSVSEIPSHQNDAYSGLFHHLLQSGFYLAPSGYEVGFISTAHTENDIEGLANAIISYYENRKEI